MAYSIPIPQYKCPCGKKAIEEVKNNRNGSHGYRCKKCAAQLVKQLNKLESEGYTYGTQ